MRVDSTLSQERLITAGIPQESVLGPLLILAYIKNVPKLPGVELLMFADNTAAYAVNPNADYAACQLQRQLDSYVV